ncbi:hypothetical protein JHK84_045324 [Glycine max]|nr:hypothetical protein JHK84_045324 [Glycine max]
MGDKDFIKLLLEKQGKVCIKLGNPFTFAEIDFQSIESKILALGLLGNPVSFLVGFHLFVVLAIRYLVGWTNPHHFSTGHQVSSRLLSMKSANALLKFPATGSIVSAETVVSAIIIFYLRPMACDENHKSPDSAFALLGIKSHKITADSSRDAEVKMAILIVSDTIAMGVGPD